MGTKRDSPVVTFGLADSGIGPMVGLVVTEVPTACPLGSGIGDEVGTVPMEAGTAAAAGGNGLANFLRAFSSSVKWHSRAMTNEELVADLGSALRFRLLLKAKSASKSSSAVFTLPGTVWISL